MTVRTARLAAGNSGPANTSKVIYTCPAGKTAIVKDARAFGRVAGTHTFIFLARSGPTECYLASGSLNPDQIFATQGFIVLEPGDTLELFSSGAQGVGYHVSGAELDGVAP